MQYACIQAHRDAFPISRMCAVLGVSRSGCSAARQRGPNQHEHADQRLRVEIRAIHRASKRRYGSPRVHEALKAQGIRCGRKRVARLMREDGLQAKRRTRFRTTTNSAPTYPVADNLLARPSQWRRSRESTRSGLAILRTFPRARAGSTWRWY